MPNSRSAHKSEYVSLRIDVKLRRRIEKEMEEFGLGFAPMVRFIINDYFKRADQYARSNEEKVVSEE